MPVTDQMLRILAEQVSHFRGVAEIVERAVKNYLLVHIDEA
jgi:hypothetical protein